MIFRNVALLCGAILLAAVPCAAGEDSETLPTVSFRAVEGAVEIEIGGRPFASYVFRDPDIRRPFLAHVQAPNGVQVTRNHPPIEDQDAIDHPTMHPGIWLAFSDLAGQDFWRNVAAVEHVEFLADPKGGAGVGGFSVKNRYQAGDQTVCEETCRIGIRVLPAGYLVLWDSELSADREIVFGDREEMGLGVRVATGISVQTGGQIANSDGLANEEQVWGRQADWCAYSGEVAGQPAGVVLMPHPDNFGGSWFHARDYGLLVANPFGRQAFTGGESGAVSLPAGAALRLRFGVLIHVGDVDGAVAWAAYVEAAREAP